MSWYYGTYSCGHEGRVNIVGPTKDREWKVEREFSGKCPECYAIWKEQQWNLRKKEATVKCAELEYPELSGSEDMVGYANVIRVDILDLLSKYLEHMKIVPVYNYKLKTKKKVPKEVVMSAIDYIYLKHVDCDFWFKLKSDSENTIVHNFYEEYLKHMQEENAPKEVKEEVVKCTVAPEQVTKPGVVEIDFKDGHVTASYFKDDEFRAIMKDKHFTWDWELKVWKRKITELTGASIDRAAEVGNALLTNGFMVRFFNIEAKDRAVSGEYLVEQTRWVKLQKSSNSLAIVWDGYNDTLYAAAKKLSGARWKDRSMNVPIAYYREVQDFAETLGFCFTTAAKEAVQTHIEEIQSVERTLVQDAKADSISDEERIKRNLKNAGTIIEDLLDDTK